MASVYSVSQVTAYIKNMFTQDFALNRISIKGEVSNCKYHTSGHIYFTLKDGGAQIAAVMFSSQRKGLDFELAEGQQVVATGTVDVYERDGRYQLYARRIERDGTGDLYARFEKLKRELAEMGMFDSCYKQPIPRYALRVGVVTAPTGAAIRDIMNISARRNPYVQLVLCPALVQGEQAPASIVRGIRRLDSMGLDVLIVGRGGGSIEDLWAFNEECVARAIFDCQTPVISAVGHETDVTIADYAADLRAPTPSAAAELAVFDYRQFEEQIGHARQRLNRLMGQALERRRFRLEQGRMKLRLYSPQRQVDERRQRLQAARKGLPVVFREADGAFPSGGKASAGAGRRPSGRAFPSQKIGRGIRLRDRRSGQTDCVRCPDRCGDPYPGASAGRLPEGTSGGSERRGQFCPERRRQRRRRPSQHRRGAAALKKILPGWRRS